MGLRQPSDWKSTEERQRFIDAHVMRYIELLCSIAPGTVLPLIKKSGNIPLYQCLELCRKHGVTDACIHLLERTGDFEPLLNMFLSDYDKALTDFQYSFERNSATVSARLEQRSKAIDA